MIASVVANKGSAAIPGCGAVTSAAPAAASCINAADILFTSDPAVISVILKYERRGTVTKSAAVRLRCGFRVAN
jgi:hypothetical protein